MDSASPLALLSRFPKGSLPQSFWGAAGVATGSRSQGQRSLGPASTSTHKHLCTGHTDTNMYKYTQACTHAHKYTRTHTQTCTVLHAASASWHHWVSIQWGLWERVSHHSHNCRLSLNSSPGLAVRGAEAGRFKNSEHESRILRMQQSFLPSPLCQRCSLCPVSTLSSFHKTTPKLRLGTWQPSFPCSYL